MILRIGLTGGIGSGKSTVAHYFAKLGVPIIDADKIAHKITQPGQSILHDIAAHFGNDILDKEGALNRKKLRQIIFQNETERQWIENLLHPIIIKKMLEKIHYCFHPYCILVIPLLAESKQIDFIDRVLVVDAPFEMQIERAKNRDQTSSADIQLIMKSQINHAKRLAIADDVITNDSDLETLKNKVDDLHKKYLNLAKQNKTNE